MKRGRSTTAARAMAEVEGATVSTPAKVRKVLADFTEEYVSDDAIAKLYVTVKIHQLEGNGQQFSHIL